MTTNSPEAIIAVFEMRPYWGPELQRQFAHSPIVIRECRALGDLRSSIVGYESVLLVIDFESAIEKCLAWLSLEAKTNLNRWPIIACGADATADLEWRLREAGVTAFLPEVVSGDAFARLCRRQLGLNCREKQ